MRALIKKIRQLLKDRRFRKIWYRSISATAAVVVFITTYALVLPAITMETEAKCGIPAHQHTTECYEEQLICGLEESDGHHHTDDCYTATKELTCTIQEHKHDESCFDEDGKLTCSKDEHSHGDSCYEEHRELTCGLEESEGHHHDSSCYKQVLTCGLEAHIHSTECYKEDSKAVTASTSVQASEDSGTAVAATAASTSVPVEIDDSDNSSDESDTFTTSSDAFSDTSEISLDDTDTSDKDDITDTNDTADASEADSTEDMTDNDSADQTTDFDEASPASSASDSDESNAESENASTAGTTDVLPEPVEQENLSEGYVPTLDPVTMEQVLDNQTGFYYFHAEEGEDFPASSAEITSWKKVEDNTELAPADLVKAYFAYTIPAGTLNETNQVARYRLPSNLHLTDDQIMAINQQENGISASYINYDTLEILDTDNYHKYLGAEAVDGTRTPDQALVEGTQEYISAVVKAENVYDDEGIYGEKGAYLGQDLIFIFTPYTIEKNQITYDAKGNPTAAGEKVSGWFACDFNMGQIDWVEAETDADLDNITVRKTANVCFAAQDRALSIKEISQMMKMVEKVATPEGAADEVSNTDPNTKNPGGTDENVATSSTEATMEMADNSVADSVDITDTESTSETEPEYKDGTLKAVGTDYTITLDYTADACIPENAELQIREITKESDPEAYKACLEQAKEQLVVSDNEKTTVDEMATRFFDIEIMAPVSVDTVDTSRNSDNDAGETSAAREKIEPKVPVAVNIQLEPKTAATIEGLAEQNSQELSGATSSDPTVLHFAEDGVETIDAAVNDGFREVETGSHFNTRVEASKDIAFEAESFSIYGVVYTSAITTTYITASGETYEITVTYDEKAGIPEDSELYVREIKNDSEEFVTYLQNTASKLGLVSSEVQFARFFDIEIRKDGEKIEPETPVHVQIKYMSPVEIAEGSSLNVVHFAENNSCVTTEIISEVEISEDRREISYQQDSFSVTGTIINGHPANGDKRMVLIKDGTRYYIVNNDASLTEVGLSEGTGPNGEDEVIVTDPMLWTFESNGSNNHIYFNSEATGFGSNLIASDYYRRYLDPDSEQAWLQEQSKNSGRDYVTVTHDYTFQNNGENVECNHIVDPTGRLDPLNATTLSYEGDLIKHGSSYLAIERDAAGTPVRMVGGKTHDDTDVAHFIFATASKVPSGLHLDNAVNHIDISIAGDAKVNVPLAYGDYYDSQGNVIKSVSENTKLSLTKENVPNDLKYMLNITTDDMKRATISARDQAGNELDDAFYVTGFSANTSTDVSTVQVRIEGRFLCADLRGTVYEHIDAGRYDGNFYSWPPQWPDGNYVNAVRQARLNNIVEYNVTVIKPVTFNLVDPVVGQLYDADGHPLTVTVDCAFSGNFNYWDYGKTAKNSGNECPPVQGNADWRRGDIPNHDMSGMDFVLSGDAENENSPLAAIEITKVIRDEEGNTIKVSVPVTNTFDIYQNKTADRNAVADYNAESYQGENDNLYTGYHLLHSRNITVDERGSGLIYDYNVTDGMYYITEEKDSVPETVTDQSGKEYTYVKTYIETEYVRRGDKYDDKNTYPDPMHVSADYTKEDDVYRSSPEVVGYFNTLTGERKKSGFLEFYVYNIYTSGKDLPVQKVWAEGTDAPDGAEVKVQLWYKARRIEDGEGTPLETLGEWTDPAPVVNGEGGFSGIEKTELTLKADAENGEKNWKDIFENLPNVITRPDGIYEVEYSTKETAVNVKVSDSDVNVIGDYVVTYEIHDGVTVITNAEEPTRLDVEKKWMENDTTETNAPDGAEVTAGLLFASRKIKNADGSDVATVPEWSECQYKEVATVAEGTGNRIFDPLFVADPLLNEEALVTSVTLRADAINASNSWKASFENLPRTLIDAQGDVYEIDYSAKESSVKIKIPGSGKTYVDDEAKDITDNYDITVKKTEGSDDVNNPSDDKITIVNTKQKVRPKVTKAWSPTIPTDENANAVVALKRYKKKESATGVTKTEASVRKVWDDANAPENVRPSSISVSLYRDSDNTPIKTVTLNDANDWTFTERNLPKFILDDEDQETEEEHVYRWLEENSSSEYSASYEYIGTTTVITNAYTPSQTILTVEKMWDDGEDQDGVRPENLTVRLMKQGSNTPVNTVSLNEGNGWKADSGLIPTREGTTPINYFWEEADMPEGYTLSGSETIGSVTTLTNSYTPKTTEAEIQIIWDDDENAEGNRPDSITVTLSNGAEEILNAGNDWHALVDNLPMYYEGNLISYTWSVPDAAGYEKPVINQEGTETEVTYSPEPEKDTILVTLSTQLRDNLPEGWNVNIWNVTVDGTNITNQLGNMYMTSYSLKPVSFEVPKGSTISYHYEVSDGIRLNGVASSDVTARSFSVNAESGSRDVMFKAGTRDVTVYNVITDRSVALNQDIIPDPKYMNITISLSTDAASYQEHVSPGFTMLKKGVFKDKLMNNKEYAFDAVAASGDGPWLYSNARVETDLDDTITYEFESFGFWNVHQNDAVVISSNAILTYDGATSNTFVFNGPSFTMQQDKKIGLIAQEGDVTIEVSVVPQASLQSSNTSDHAAAMAYNDGTQMRTFVSQNLKADVPIDQPQTDTIYSFVRSASNRTHLFKRAILPGLVSLKNRNNGALVLKAVGESTSNIPEGYEIDDDFDSIELTLSNSLGWTRTFEEQEKYDELGNEYIYYVEEVSCYPEDYEVSSMTGDLLTEGGVTITNTKASRTGSLKITKSVLVNGESTTGKLADGTYTFQIWNADATSQITKKADGSTDIGTLEITVTDGQASPAELLVEDLPAATYIVKETGSTNGATIIDTSVSGYDTTHGGIAVTVTPDNTSNIPTAAFVNKYDTTDVSVAKIWNDNNNAKNKRPASLTVTLLENGEESGKTVTLNSSNSWTDTISGLPKYKNNAIIDYQWYEGDMPAGYFLTGTSTSGTVTTLTNTLQEYDLKTSYVGVKSWTDEGNKYSTRPDNLEVKLYANNVVTSYVPVWTKDTATNQWTYTFADIPVFDANGDVISYRAEETVPAGYKKTSQTQTPTSYSVGTITWEESKDRITPNHQVVWTLQSTIDMAFVAIKPTSNGDVVVWTHRIPTPDEKAAIERVIKVDDALNGCSKRNIVYYTGIGESVYTPHGNVAISYNATAKTITIDFGSTDVWAHFICGQFNGGGGSSYEIGTTSFTNELETKDLSGTKTWEILGDTIPDNPILTLTRTVTTDNGSGTPVTSAPETVTVVNGGNTVNLQPVWTGTGDTRTFTYSGLPKFDKNGKEYTYEVAEASFVIGSGDNAVTYTAVKASDGTYTLTPSKSGAAKIVATQTGNAITNTEVKDFEFSKIWRDMNGSDESWPISKTITVKLNASTTTTQKALADTEVVLGPEPTVLPAGWTYVTSADGKKTTFKTTNLAAKKNGEELNYYVVEVRVDGYKDPIYATSEGHSIPNGRAMDKQQVINTPEDGVELPSTGGPGTRLYYLIGTAFTALALGLIWKKRYRLP